MLRITVGKGGEDYLRIQDAVNAVPYDTPAEIVISGGVYHEKIFSDKADLSIRGSGDVYIINSDSALETMERGEKRGTFRSYTAFFGGGRLRLSGITIANGAGSGRLAGQAVALYLDAARAELEDVTILSHQDTLFLSPLPDHEREKGGFYGPRHLSKRRRTASVFRSCRISGSVDFIFGGGDALFEDCTIESVEPGFVAAPSGKKDWTGLVFLRSSFVSGGAPDGSVYLMRPWRPEGKAYFIDCSFGSHIRKEGKCAWEGEARDDSVFRVLSSSDEEAVPVLSFFRSVAVDAIL